MELEAPRIVDGPPMRIAGLDQRYEYPEISAIPELWGRFAPHLGSIPGQVGFVTYGVCHQMDAQGLRYMAGVEVTGAGELPDGFTTVSVPAQRYAVFNHPEAVNRITETCSAIWSQWLPGSGYRVADAPALLERYGEGFDPQTGSGDITIWFPIQP